MHLFCKCDSIHHNVVYAVQYSAEANLKYNCIFTGYRSNYIDYINKLFIFTDNRFAGTIGAIVTCPLEVVKTRLQSSSSPFYPSPAFDAAKKVNSNGGQLKGTTQNRDICTSILRKRSQVSIQ